MLVIWLLMIDFIDYWNYCLLYMCGFWDIYVVYYLDEVLNWIISLCVYVFEIVVMQMSYILLVSWMNILVEGVGVIVVLCLFYNNWVYMVYDFYFGLLIKIILILCFYYWYYVDDKDVYDINFVNMFVVWDVLFCIYCVFGVYCGGYGFEGIFGNDVGRLLIWLFL